MSSYRGLLAATVTGLALATTGAATAAPPPIPPGPLDATLDSFEGEAVEDRPVAAPPVPQHPFMAPNGTNSMHNDAYATDAYEGGGPRGENLQVTSASYGVAECATVTFDSRGRLVGLCGGLEGFRLMLIDPDTLESQASYTTSRRDVTSGANPLTDLCGGAYFYLDHRDRAVVETSDGRVLVVEVTDSGFRLVEEYDVTPAIPEGDCLIALLPDWEGLIWFVTKDGGVGTLDPASHQIRSVRLPGERIVNSFATDPTGGVFIVSDHALYRFDVASGAPSITWREPYDRGSRQKPGQLSQGSGTTPTLIGDDLVVITDNADPQMNVLSFRRTREPVAYREVCRQPVFRPGESATENTLVAVGHSVVAENNYGYENPGSTMLGRSTTPGVARVGVTADNCGLLWSSDVTAPTSVPKVSLKTGLLYVYEKPGGVEQDPWYVTALDVRTGRTAWRRLTGTGAQWNNHYAAIYLSSSRVAYIATPAGLVRLEDG
jgi:hypothetical protein